jgi:hypothetical protein
MWRSISLAAFFHRKSQGSAVGRWPHAQDIQDVEGTLPDIVRDTTKTEGASLKLKRILGKLGKDVYSIAIKVVTDIASETAKKTLGIGI